MYEFFSGSFRFRNAVEREHKDNEEHVSQHGGQDGVKRQWMKAAKVLTTQQQVKNWTLTRTIQRYTAVCLIGNFFLIMSISNAI